MSMKKSTPNPNSSHNSKKEKTRATYKHKGLGGVRIKFRQVDYVVAGGGSRSSGHTVRRRIKFGSMGSVVAGKGSSSSGHTNVNENGQKKQDRKKRQGIDSTTDICSEEFINSITKWGGSRSSGHTVRRRIKFGPMGSVVAGKGSSSPGRASVNENGHKKQDRKKHQGIDSTIDIRSEELINSITKWGNPGRGQFGKEISWKNGNDERNKYQDLPQNKTILAHSNLYHPHSYFSRQPDLNKNYRSMNNQGSCSTCLTRMGEKDDPKERKKMIWKSEPCGCMLGCSDCKIWWDGLDIPEQERHCLYCGKRVERCVAQPCATIGAADNPHDHDNPQEVATERQQESVPIRLQETVPEGEQEGVPKTQQKAVPKIQQEAVPRTQQEEAALETQQEAVPRTHQDEAVPKTQQDEAVPKTQQKPAPATQKQQEEEVHQTDRLPVESDFPEWDAEALRKKLPKRQHRSVPIRQQEFVPEREEGVPKTRQKAVSNTQQEAVPGTQRDGAVPKTQQEPTPTTQQQQEEVHRTDRLPVESDFPECDAGALRKKIVTKRQESVPMRQQKSGSEREQEGVPKTQQKAVPKTQQEAVPKTQQEAAPKTQQQEAVLETQQEAIPKTQQEAVPEIQQEPAPETQQQQQGEEVHQTDRLPIESNFLEWDAEALRKKLATERQESVPIRWQESMHETEQEGAPKTQQEDAVPKTQQEEAVPKTQQEEAVPKTQQEQAVPKTQQEQAVPKTQQEGVPETQQEPAPETQQQQEEDEVHQTDRLPVESDFPEWDAEALRKKFPRRRRCW